MPFLGFVLLLSYHLCRSSVGADPVEVGVSFTSQDQEFNKNKSADTLPDPDIPSLELLIPILAFFIFSLLSIGSFLIYKRKDLRHPGGIMGSIVHYHRDTTGTD